MSRVCVLYDSNKFHVRYSALNTLSTRLAQILGTPVYARLRDVAQSVYETSVKRLLINVVQYDMAQKLKSFHEETYYVNCVICTGFNVPVNNIPVMCEWLTRHGPSPFSKICSLLLKDLFYFY